MQMVTTDAHIEGAEQQMAGGDFINQCIQPIDQQEFQIGRTTFDREGFMRFDMRGSVITAISASAAWLKASAGQCP